MISYKRLWIRLKSNVKDQKILNLMDEYERNAYGREHRKRKLGEASASISKMDKPWYNTYKLIRQVLYHKMYRHIISKDVCIQFKEDFNKYLDGLAFGKITNEEMQNWLSVQHKKYINDPHYRKEFYTIKKERLTHSGFERKPKTRMSMDERAAIVIDDFVHKFTPKTDNKYNLQIERYEEDWRQELWVWCWELYKNNRDTNLRQLIVKYNDLSRGEYAFHNANFLSRMNRYINSYIACLQYSCNDISKFTLNDRYKKEELYPSDNLLAKTLNVKPSLLEDEIISNLDKNSLIIQLINYFNDNYNADHNIMWLRYIDLLKMRYGFNEDDKIYTFSEIATQFGVSKQRAQQIEMKMLSIIKRYLHIKLKKKENCNGDTHV